MLAPGVRREMSGLTLRAFTSTTTVVSMGKLVRVAPLPGALVWA